MLSQPNTNGGHCSQTKIAWKKTFQFHSHFARTASSKIKSKLQENNHTYTGALLGSHCKKVRFDNLNSSVPQHLNTVTKKYFWRESFHSPRTKEDQSYKLSVRRNIVNIQFQVICLKYIRRRTFQLSSMYCSACPSFKVHSKSCSK